MLQAEQVYIRPFAEGSEPCAQRLRSLGRRIFRFRPLRNVQPHLRKLLSVAEPAGQVRFRNQNHGQPPAPSEALTVISANLCHDWPRHRQLAERLESFARLVEGQHADLALLQEVARTPDLRADEWLAERLGMDFVYSRANGHEMIGFEEGLAVYSRYPIGRPYLRDLGSACNPLTRRLALGVEIKTPHGQLMAFTTHLGLLPGQNAAQMARLRDWVAELSGDHPALVGGDFNAPESAAQIGHARSVWLDTFRALNPHGDGATHTLRWPWGAVLRRERLDYLFLRPGKSEWGLLEARYLETEELPHSDHQAVLTRLEYPLGIIDSPREVEYNPC